MKNHLNPMCLRGAIAVMFILSSIFACGCGGKGAKGSTLSGKVLFKDEPLTGGSITLQSTDGKKLYKGMIGADGAFAIGGIAPGEMVVVIETESIKGQTASDMEAKRPKYVEIPQAYGDPSATPLRVTVSKTPKKVQFSLNESGQ